MTLFIQNSKPLLAAFNFQVNYFYKNKTKITRQNSVNSQLDIRLNCFLQLTVCLILLHAFDFFIR